MDLRDFRMCDGSVEVEKSAEMTYLGIVRSGEFETGEVAASGSVDGGMDGVGAPLDEEGKQAIAVVFQVESFPLEKAAIGTFAGAGIGAVEGDVCVAEARCEFVEIAGMSGPAD